MSATGRENAEQARLLQSVFIYIATCIRDRDHRTVERLRLRPVHVERIARLTATDLVRIGELAGRCVTFAIDSAALEDVLRSLEQRRARDEIIERCIRRGAPRAMMQTFFGISRHRYSRLRSLLAVPEARGRLRRPSEAVDQRIFSMWSTSSSRWTAQALLDIADALNISVRVVWERLAKHR